MSATRPFEPAWTASLAGEHYLSAGPLELCIFVVSLSPSERAEHGPKPLSWRWEIYSQSERIAEGCNEGIADLDRVKADCITHAQQHARAIFDAVGWLEPA